MPFPFTESLFWIAVGACAVAQVAILRSVVQSGVRQSDGKAGAPGTSAVGGRTATRATGEVLWALIPGLVLALVFAWTWHTIHPSHRSTAIAPTARAPGPVVAPNPSA